MIDSLAVKNWNMSTFLLEFWGTDRETEEQSNRWKYYPPTRKTGDNELPVNMSVKGNSEVDGSK